MQSLTVVAAELLAGVLTHVLYFNRGEHHLAPSRHIQGYALLYAAGVVAAKRVQDVGIVQAFATVSTAFAWYLLGLYGSLLAYRLLFHPLNKFPGPLGARISNLYLSTRYSKGDAYLQIQGLHQKYGDYVRIGSSDLSIADPHAVSVIHGFGSKCTKTPWYDIIHPMVSLQLDRNKASHDRKRRVWSTAFSDKALRGYETRMRVYREKLWTNLSAFSGQAVNITKWFDLYSWDVMGDMAFGKPFDMLDSKTQHWAVKLVNDGNFIQKFQFPVWFIRLLTSIPGATKDFWRQIDFCKQRLIERMNMKIDTPDVMASLLASHENRQPSEKEMQDLIADSQLVIVAGSDTTSATLAFMCNELAKKPEQIERLRLESTPYLQEDGTVLNKDVANLDHLNAVIYETLRMHPPVPTHIDRLTPPEGITIAETFIPGNTVVACPSYVIGRSEEAYQRPNEFIPQRWTSQPELVKVKSAWAPFSIGTYGCIGRPLAMMNLRVTLTELIHRFDISLAPGEDPMKLDKETVENFTLELPELKMCLMQR